MINIFSSLFESLTKQEHIIFYGRPGMVVCHNIVLTEEQTETLLKEQKVETDYSVVGMSTEKIDTLKAEKSFECRIEITKDTKNRISEEGKRIIFSIKPYEAEKLSPKDSKFLYFSVIQKHVSDYGKESYIMHQATIQTVKSKETLPTLQSFQELV